MATRPATRCKAHDYIHFPEPRFSRLYPMPSIRPSTDGDIPAITAIYRHHVLHGTGTFEIDPPTEADMAARRADVLVVATVLAEVNGDMAMLKAQTQCSKPLQRLRLDYLACESFLKESANEIAALRDALG